MKIRILTLFPDMIKGFFAESIVKRAVENKLVKIEIINLRNFAEEKHHTVDDRPYGGGAGMVMKVDVLDKAIQNSKLKIKNSKVILTSAKGKIFNQQKALEYSRLESLVIIAGHYEGVDERAMDLIDEEISMGDFVMTGGEIAASGIVDAVVRLIPGVLKKNDATQDESFFTISINRLIEIVGEHEVLLRLKKEGVANITLLEYPHYTRPEEHQGKKVPEVLRSGNQKLITAWKLQEAFKQTLKKRPDLLKKIV